MLYFGCNKKATEQVSSTSEFIDVVRAVAFFREKATALFHKKMKNLDLNLILTTVKQYIKRLFSYSLFFVSSKSSKGSPIRDRAPQATVSPEKGLPSRISNGASPAVSVEAIAVDYTGFKSSFKAWIRTVALIVILVFTPEQISWAFHYNPAVLWGERKVDAYLGVKEAATISESIRDLLTDRKSVV